MKNEQLLRVGAIVASLVVLAGPALGSEFYGVTRDGAITRFDMTAHTVTPVSTIHAGPTSPTGFQDLDFDGAGNLYAVRSFFDFNTFSSFNEMYRITNPTTGNALLGGSFGFPSFFSLAWRSSASSYYSINASNGNVCTIQTNGAFTPVSGVGNGPRNLVESLAVNPTSGQAYALVDMGIPIAGTIDYSLFSVNLDTGLSTIIGSLNQTQGNFQSLRFDETGTAYSVDVFTGKVYTVDLATGAGSFLFDGGSAAVNTYGLTLIAVPAPAGASLLLIGGGILSRRRRR